MYSKVVLLSLLREPQCSSVWGVELFARLLLWLFSSSYNLFPKLFQYLLIYLVYPAALRYYLHLFERYTNIEFKSALIFYG